MSLFPDLRILKKLTKETIGAALAGLGFKPVVISPEEGVFSYLQVEFYQRELAG